MAKGAGFELSSSELLLTLAAVGVLLYATGSTIKPLTQGVGNGITDLTGVVPWVEHQIEGFEHWVGGWT